ncbi:DUF917 domain-containing protein [Spirillospora sp. CA-294931]|uniref:DUF917 domain-containing protein n=1 Tax=Spirillospora sp. CA-294931 TaxID=3240042 RepID=UPI003D91AE81
MRRLDERLLGDITIGSAVLGSGGGGDPYIGMLLARAAIRESGPVPLVSLAELPDDARVAFVAAVGAPGVLIEKIPRAEDAVAALDMLERHLGYSFTHIAPIEAGGLNAVTPIAPAAHKGIPIVDADGMGRAFPTLDLVTPSLYGGSATPMALADEHGNRMVLETRTNLWSEVIGRAATVASGCIQFFASYPMTGVQAREWLVDAPLTRAARLGALIRTARAEHSSPVEAIIEEEDGVRLIEGKIASVERRTERGWTMGEAVVHGTGPDLGRTMRLLFQNEYLVALRDENVIASTPDIIMTLEAETGEPIPAEEIRYGFRVAAVALPGDERWRSPAGIELSGPRRFGYDFDYAPVEALV